MNIQEFYDSIDENYENVSSRMMGNQKLVEKFVRKFLEDPTYKQIKEYVEKMDYDPDVSFANIENRLKMLVMNAKQEILEEKEERDHRRSHHHTQTEVKDYRGKS